MVNKLTNRLKKLETLLASFLFLIPLILILVNNEVRPSISDYAYSDNVNVFVLLLSAAGFMFIYNGYLKSNKYYNILLGISLIGVALTPHLDYSILHYMFAFVFFAGSVYAMIYYSSNEQRFFKILAGTFILVTILIHYVFNIYSLFVAEWIGLLPISIHFIGESNNKID